MFQSPRKRWTWFLAPGRLADGTEIEVLRRAPLDWSQPSDPQSEQRGFRWILYLEAAIARGVYDPPFRVTHPAFQAPTPWVPPQANSITWPLATARQPGCDRLARGGPPGALTQNPTGAGRPLDAHAPGAAQKLGVVSGGQRPGRVSLAPHGERVSPLRDHERSRTPRGGGQAGGHNSGHSGTLRD